jgi:hypothetical protein
MTTRLSPSTVETLIDLVEIKLSMIVTLDSEGRREQRDLQRCLFELQSWHAHRQPAKSLAA